MLCPRAASARQTLGPCKGSEEGDEARFDFIARGPRTVDRRLKRYLELLQGILVC